MDIDQVVVGAITVLLYFAAAVVSCAAVIFTVAITANAGIAYTIAVSLAAFVDVKVSGVSVSYPEITQNFDIWVLAKSHDDEIVLRDAELTKAVDDVVYGFNDVLIENAIEFDDSKIKQTINLNINKQLDILSNPIQIEDNETNI